MMAVGWGAGWRESVRGELEPAHPHVLWGLLGTWLPVHDPGPPQDSQEGCALYLTPIPSWLQTTAGAQHLCEGKSTLHGHGSEDRSA